jgi:argininosuccinate lyase
MENTGRILRTLTPTARRILFGETVDGHIGELKYITQVDLAHLVMLREQGFIERDECQRLFRAIRRLRDSNFAPLKGRIAPRGLYLLYENYLIEELGIQTGGVLQTARSRNDLNATVLKLRLRQPFLQLTGEALRLQAILIRRASKYADVVMPAYTHFQAAVPITYGHYLAGIAQALERDIVGLFQAGADLNRCPLGAGAVGGTSLHIAPTRTAQLLGFEHCLQHSIDAVASRDSVLRLLAGVCILCVTLSRVATDLLIWSTAEFGFLSFPDQLVGSSSMMPQKRNPFLLEHIQGRCGSPMGAFVAASTAMHATPFTNSIAVGTEAMSHVWKALQDATEAATLLRLAVADARPNQEAMLQRAVEGYTSATALANRLMVEGHIPFRTAHHTVGAIVREASEKGSEPMEIAAARMLGQGPEAISLQGLNPGDVARSSVYGGGPGSASLSNCLAALHANWSMHWQRRRAMTQKWHDANVKLEWITGDDLESRRSDHVTANAQTVSRMEESMLKGALRP